MVCRKVQASFTVEASFVVPIVFYIVFALIYVGFYLYDAAVLQNCMEEVLWEQDVTAGYCFSPSEKKREQEEMKKRLTTKTGHSLHVLKIDALRASSETLSLRLEVETRLYVTLPGSKVFLRGPAEAKKTQCTRKRICPTQFARAYKATGEVISELKGAGNVEKMQKKENPGNAGT